MTAFQYIGLGLVVSLVVFSAVSVVRTRGRAGSVFWLVLWCSAAVAIAAPDSTTHLANTLGITRGADLVLYSSVLAGLVGFFLVYSQLRRLNRQITLVVRELALTRSEVDASRSIGQEGAGTAKGDLPVQADR